MPQSPVAGTGAIAVVCGNGYNEVGGYGIANAVAGGNADRRNGARALFDDGIGENGSACGTARRQPAPTPSKPPNLPKIPEKSSKIAPAPC